jgi:hypothetical protein
MLQPVQIGIARRNNGITAAIMSYEAELPYFVLQLVLLHFTVL